MNLHHVTSLFDVHGKYPLHKKAAAVAPIWVDTPLAPSGARKTQQFPCDIFTVDWISTFSATLQSKYFSTRHTSRADPSVNFVFWDPTLILTISFLSRDSIKCFRHYHNYHILSVCIQIRLQQKIAIGRTISRSVGVTSRHVRVFLLTRVHVNRTSFRRYCFCPLTMSNLALYVSYCARGSTLHVYTAV